MSSTTDTVPILVKDRVRVLIFFKRKQGSSREEFRQHYLEHGNLFRSLEVSKPITRYDQLHVNDEASELLAGMGVPTGEWDGIALLEARSFADVVAILSSEEYKQFLVPDEEKFLDRSALQVIPVDFSVVIPRDGI